MSVNVDQLRTEVRRKYEEVASDPSRQYHFHTGRQAARNAGYRDGWLDGIPDSALASFAGVANPFHWGELAPGERVIDIGSGAGTDALIAAKMVGPEGAVIGIDMTPAMLERARAAARHGGFSNVEFREGVAERLPVDAGWADVIISNGVLNLVPDKLGAYKQIFRALKPGGRLQIADICVEKPVSEEAKRDIDLWTG